MATNASTASGDDPIAEGIAEHIITVGNAGVNAQKNAQEAQKSLGVLESIYREAAKSMASIELAKGTAELKAQQATVKAANAAGVNPESAADVILNLMTKVGETNKKLLENTATVAKQRSSTLWDDPVQFIKDNFNLPDSERKLEASLMESKVVAGQIGVINQAVSQAADTYRKIAEPLNASVIQSRTELAAIDALAQAEKAKIEGLKYNTESLMAIANVSKQVIDARIALHGLKNADVNLALALERHKLQVEEFDWRRSEKAIADAAKKADQQIDDQTLAYINRSKAVLGQPPMNASEYKFQKELLKQNKSPELAYHLQNGMRMATLGINTVGATPAESLEVTRVIDSNLGELEKETLSLIEAAESFAKKKPRDPKDKEGLIKDINATVKAEIDSRYQTITPDSILAVGDLKNYLGSTAQPGVAPLFNLPVAKKILIPAIDAGVSLNDPKTVLGLVTKAVQKGDLSSSEALGLADIYRRASQLNLTARGFTKFGIVIPDNGTKYQVRIGGFGNSRLIDMNDPVAISAYIANALRPADSSAAGQLGFGAP